MDDIRLNILLDKSLALEGIAHYHTFSFIHILTVGASGSGKTYLNKLIVGKIALKIPDAKITILDFKADDYHFLRSIGGSRLYEFEAVKTGLEVFYQEFLDRQQGRDADRSFRLLVIEELGSMLGYFPKGEGEKLKNMISNMIFMGRSMNCHLLVSTQRPDSSNFGAGVRDSINCVIALGNLSKEGRGMIFSGFQDEMNEVHGQGSGYMLLDGAKLFSVKVPYIGDMKKLEVAIIRGVT